MHRSFTGKLLVRTELEALRQVLAWMWNQHGAATGEARPAATFPTEETVLEAGAFAEIWAAQLEEDPEQRGRGRGRGRGRERGRGRGLRGGQDRRGAGRGGRARGSQDPAPAFSGSDDSDSD
jgi:hypothetical protein